MTDEINFNASREELTKIQKIVNRVRDNPLFPTPGLSNLDLEISMVACHLNGCPLDLDRMLNHDRLFDLVHDVFGIHNHVNKTNGKLENFFLPRFAAQENKHAG